MKKVFLDDLPKRGTTEQINWGQSVGRKVPFVYDDIEGEITIVDYSNSYLTIDYKGNNYKKFTGSFVECSIGDILGVFIYGHRYQVGEEIGWMKILEQIRIGKKRYKGYLYECMDCGYKDKIKEENIHKKIGCNRCGDGLPYTEKFISAMFTQLPFEYLIQVTPVWAKNVHHQNSKLCGDKRYDGYLPQFNLFLEIHGEQHYGRGFSVSDLTFHDIQENDSLKIRIAKNNGCNVVTIDARKSDLNYIKNSIMKSELSKLIDLDLVDFSKCHEVACNSLVKDVCEMWNKKMSVRLIAYKLSLNTNTIVTYLKRGQKVGWCDYDPDKNRKDGLNEGRKKSWRNLRKPVVRMSLLGEYIDEFESATDAARKLNLQQSKISSVCIGNRSKTGGHKWAFKEDYLKSVHIN